MYTLTLKTRQIVVKLRRPKYVQKKTYIIHIRLVESTRTIMFDCS